MKMHWIARGMLAGLLAALPFGLHADEVESRTLIGTVSEVDLEYRRLTVDDHLFLVPEGLTASLATLEPGAIVTIEYEATGEGNVATQVREEQLGN